MTSSLASKCQDYKVWMPVQFGLQNAYVPEGGNEEKKGATPTSILIFDSYDIKTLKFEFGHDIFTGFKMPALSQ